MAKVRMPDVQSMGGRQVVSSAYRPVSVSQEAPVAKALIGLSAEVAQQTDEISKKLDLANAQRAMTELTNFASQSLYDPEKGALARRGRNAVGSAEEYSRSYDAQVQRLSQGLSARAREAFMVDAAQRRTAFSQTLMGHTLREVEAFETADAKANWEATVNSIGLHYNQPDIVAQEKGRLTDSVAAYGRSRGWSDVQIAETVRQLHASSDFARWNRAVAAGDVATARALADTGTFNATDRDAVETQLRTLAKEETIRAVLSGEARVGEVPALRGVQNRPARANPSRGDRNNNPLNIKRTQGLWRGEVLGDDPTFKTFASYEDGRASAQRLLVSYQEVHGLNTVNAIINRWAPPSDNNPTPAYARKVADALGVAPDAPIDLRDRRVLERMTDAMELVENGYSVRESRGTLPAQQDGVPQSADAVLRRPEAPAVNPEVPLNALPMPEMISVMRGRGYPEDVIAGVVTARRSQETAQRAETKAAQESAKQAVFAHALSQSLHSDEGQAAMRELERLDPEQAFQMSKTLATERTTDLAVYSRLRNSIAQGAEADVLGSLESLSQADAKALLDMQANSLKPDAPRDYYTESSRAFDATMPAPASTSPANKDNYERLKGRFAYRMDTEILNFRKANRREPTATDLAAMQQNLLLTQANGRRMFEDAPGRAQAPAFIQQGSYVVKQDNGRLTPPLTAPQVLDLLANNLRANGLVANDDTLKAAYQEAVESGVLLAVQQ